MKDFLCLERPFLDLVLQSPRPRGGGGPLFTDSYRFNCRDLRGSLRKGPLLGQGRT